MTDDDEAPDPSGNHKCPACGWAVPYYVTVQPDADNGLTVGFDWMDFDAHALTEHGIVL